MARKKSNKFIGVFQIFFSSIKTYFLYLDQCAKQLAFPIFGQIISIILIFTATYFFAINIDNIKEINPFFENDKNLLISFLIIIAPLFLIFLKAFFDYIIAFSSLNLLFYTVSNRGKAKNIDFSANNNVIKRKLPKYILLMLLTTLLLIIPPMLFVAPIIWIYLCLSFQVFALEGDVSAPKAISRSIELVKGNVVPTIILLVLSGFATYVFLPNLFLWTFEKISLTTFFVTKFETFFTLLPIEDYNQLLSTMNFSLNRTELGIMVYTSMISFFVTGFTLPFRCCCFTELYRLYDADKIKENSKQTDEIISRATGKKRKN